MYGLAVVTPLVLSVRNARNIGVAAPPYITQQSRDIHRAYRFRASPSDFLMPLDLTLMFLNRAHMPRIVREEEYGPTTGRRILMSGARREGLSDSLRNH